MRFIVFLATIMAAHASLAYDTAADDTVHGTMSIAVEGVISGQPIPASQALCVATKDGKSKPVTRILRPTIRWSGAPEGTESIALFMMDPDVPADFTDAGQEGKILAVDSERQDFYHYGIVHLPADATQLLGGVATRTPTVGMELLNDLGIHGYVSPKTAYGGPCPPWNDARLHHYHFIVLALDAEAFANADEDATARDTFHRLMESPHVLASGTIVGTYTLNPDLR
jgi:phosphatidylethanolamine-binding protein (PEBP) family uncharacterized protein